MTEVLRGWGYRCAVHHPHSSGQAGTREQAGTRDAQPQRSASHPPEHWGSWAEENQIYVRARNCSML